MPITTRTVALGIPPRILEANPKKKTSKGKATKKLSKGTAATSKKRAPSKSDSDDNNNKLASEDSEPRKKKNVKRRRTDSGPEPDVEVIVVDTELIEEVEEVEAIG